MSLQNILVLMLPTCGHRCSTRLLLFSMYLQSFNWQTSSQSAANNREEDSKQGRDSRVNAVEGASKMDQVCTTGVSDRPAVAGNDPAKRVNGDVPAAAGGGCFDCNICLDFAVEPVVTLCGHLYCWPCIYEWLRHDAEADTSDGRGSRRPCPVCKASLTPDTLVPLYGRGGSCSNRPRHDMATIPHRPTAHQEGVERQSAQSSDDSGRRHESTEPDPPARSPRHAHHLASAARFDVLYPPPLGRGMNTIHSTAGGVLGGMAVAVLPRVFRGQVPPPSAYYSSPQLAAVQDMSPRLRLRHMEVERCLHQIWFFLCVLVVLCLLLF